MGVAAFVTPTFAQLQLARATFAYAFTSMPEEPTLTLSVRPAYFDPTNPANPAVVAALFSNRSFTAADAGTTFEADASNDAGFAQFVERLTDGANTLAGLSIAFGGHPDIKIYSFENGWWKLDSGLSGPDLHGYAIDRVDLTFNRLQFHPSPAAGMGSSVQFDVEVAVYSASQLTPVPEPSTIGASIVCVIAIGAIAVTRRRRESRSAAD